MTSAQPVRRVSAASAPRVPASSGRSAAWHETRPGRKEQEERLGVSGEQEEAGREEEQVEEGARQIGRPQIFGDETVKEGQRTDQRQVADQDRGGEVRVSYVASRRK
jgi:hypothetical protein